MIEYKVKAYNDREIWYLNGRLHRADGPAIKRSNGNEYWYLEEEMR